MSPQTFSEFQQPAAIQIFNTFLKGHLSPPDGNRSPEKRETDEEVNELDEDDRSRFKEQLQSMGFIARLVPGHSLPLLCKLLESKMLQFQSMLESLHQKKEISETETRAFETLCEDINWLILVSGHVIALDSKCGPDMIPSEITQYSTKQKANVEISMRVLASPHLPISSIPGAEESADHVIRLVAAVLRFCEIEKKVIEANLNQLVSPEVAVTILWFLRHWSLSYLLSDESFLNEISMPLSFAFGQDSEGAMWTINYLMSKIESHLLKFASEPTIISGCVELLTSIVNLRVKAVHVLKSAGFWRLVELYQTIDVYVMPSAAKRGLMRAFILAGAGVEDTPKREEYWNQVLRPIQGKFTSIVGNEKFKQMYQDERTRADLVEILEAYIGLATGIEVITVHSLFRILMPLLTECPNLIGVYSQYNVIVELTLELLCECANSMISYLTADESGQFYSTCLQTIQAYANSSLGRRSVNHDNEEAFNDIQLLLTLLTNLLSRDLIDLSPQPDASQQHVEVSAVEMCLYGLRMLLPLMNIDLLNFPTLSKKYFKLLKFMAELFPDKVVAQEDDLLKGILTTIQLGLQSYTPEINEHSCDFIIEIGCFLRNSGKCQTALYLKPFLKIVMDMILLHHVNTDDMYSMGTCMHVLIACYEEEYRALIQCWVNSQPDPEVGRRLAEAFQDLMAGVELGDRFERRNSKFKDNFEKFVVSVHGFLLVK